MADRIEMPLWGWGDPGHARSLAAPAEAALNERLGLSPSEVPPAKLEDFSEVPSALSPEALDALGRAAGASAVSVDFPTRLLRSTGKSYPDLVRMWLGEKTTVPDAVVRVSSDEGIQAVLNACANHSIAVVPFGGGTSVVGGLEAIRGSNAAVVSLDLRGCEGLVDLDPESMIARVRAGTSGPQFESLIQADGLTLGHFPQSFEFATIGGFAATRSAGQASTGYGRFDRNVLGLNLITPSGTIDLPAMPGTAAGPGLRQLVVGSEGVFGVIADVSVQLAKRPGVTADRAWFAPSFEAGWEAMRALEQAGVAPDVSRLSDEQETEVSLLTAGDGTAQSALARYLRLRGVQAGCLLIGGFEGEESDVSHRLGAANVILRRHGAVALGSVIGKAWRKGRFSGPYLRDVLMGRGLMVDTLETATRWSNLSKLYAGVRGVIESQLAQFGGEPIVMCHVSHLYASGASLYFTWIGRQPGSGAAEQISNWHGVKKAAGDAIAANGGTITHHHAIGTDHAEWLGLESGERGLDAIRAVKRELDPTGIMNPGKLI